MLVVIDAQGGLSGSLPSGNSRRSDHLSQSLLVTSGRFTLMDLYCSILIFTGELKLKCTADLCKRMDFLFFESIYLVGFDGGQ